MVKGIEFYRDYIKVESLKNSYDCFNKLFDVFNQKFPAEGIKKIVPIFWYIYLYLIKI